MSAIGTALGPSLGGVLIAVVLFVFMRDLRTVAVSFVSVPLALLTAILVIDTMGGTINTMTLGGLAIAIGEVVDDAIIDTENIFRRLRENRAALLDGQIAAGTGLRRQRVQTALKRLRDRGDEVVVLARRPEKAAGLDAEVAEGDLSDADAIRRLRMGDGRRGQCGQRGSHVDGDNGGELHGGAFVVWWHDCAGSTSPCPPVCDRMQSGRSEMQPRGVNGSRKKGALTACHVRATGAF